MIVLDTHAWIWHAVNSPKLSQAARQAIAGADKLGVHIISCWEVAMLVEKGRLQFDREANEWVMIALQRPKVELLPFSPENAVLAAKLKDFHGDPADRFIVSACLLQNSVLVTRDEAIHAWGQAEVIW